jgi:hypothetical protein
MPIPLDREEVVKLLRKVLKNESEFLVGTDRMLARHLAGNIQLDEVFQVVDPDHQKSLDYLDSIAGIIMKFDAESMELITRELDL